MQETRECSPFSRSLQSHRHQGAVCSRTTGIISDYLLKHRMPEFATQNIPPFWHKADLGLKANESKQITFLKSALLSAYLPKGLHALPGRREVGP